MATFLDISGLQAFSKVFVFLIVLLIMYATTMKLGLFQNNKIIASLIAVVLAILVILSDLATNIIEYTAPWFIVLIVFLVFVTMASKLFGTGPADIGQYKGVVIMVVVLIFVVGVVSYIRSEIDVPGDLDEDGNEIVEKNYNTTASFIFHPNVLGIIFLLLVSVFTVALMAGKAS